MSAKILTHSGYWFDLEHPETSYISIDDIAHALSNACRFTGQCDRFYSVAQHCVNVSYVVDEGLALAALLHDASEAYTGDMNSPLKSLCPEFRAIELRIQSEVYRRFCLPTEDNYRVKQADTRVFVAERRMLFNFISWKMPDPTEVGVVLEFPEPMLPGEAKSIFKKRFRDISKHA
jgi:hypothetical protein